MPLVAATLIALAGYMLPAAHAQPKRPGPAAERPQRRQTDRPDRTPGADHCPHARLGRLPGARLFRPLPGDQGPLTPEEQHELVNFVRQHAPNIHASLKQLRKRDPDNFSQRLQKAAPLLRRLRRIFERDPELGRSIIRHSEKLQRLRQARRAWLDSAGDRRTRREIEDVMRRTVAENVRIELAVLEDQVRELEWQRDARIEAEFERLTSPDADLTGEPPELRGLVRLLHEAQAKDELTWLEDELWLVCAARMDREVRALQQRVERMRTSTAEEVDRRMQRLTSPDEPGSRRDRNHNRKRRD